MKNLAGVKEADKTIREELYFAGIPMFTEQSDGEVPYTIIGKIGHWTFRRAWYYWVARADEPINGLPLNIALELHNKKSPISDINLGETIRSGGHGGALSPAEYGAQPIYNDELDEQLKALGYKEVYHDFLKRKYIPISVGEVSDLCNEGKLNVEQYVDCYHIDDQIGLKELAETIKKL